MRAPRSTKEKVARMWQEAELYEAQGLYSHALQICHRIVSMDPRHKKARAKLNQMEFPNPAESSWAATPDEDSTEARRLWLDLGVAYMGMDLYSEALEEFDKGLKKAPVHRVELMHHSTICFIRLRKTQEARDTLIELLADPSLPESDKGEIISEMAGVYVEETLHREALRLLLETPDELRQYIPDYDKILAETVTASAEHYVAQVLVEDTDTGEVYQAQPAVLLEDLGPAATTEAKPAPEESLERGEEDLEPDSVDFIDDEEDEEIGPVEMLSPEKAIELAERDSTDSVRFACVCGKMHFATQKWTGALVKCGACGREMTVPRVDDRRDSLSNLAVGKMVGGCRVLYRIGGGGMGGVFKGHHIGLDIPVAIKILHAHLADRDPVFIKRFIREARASARLQHPNVAGVLNVGFEDGMHFLVMPYVGGGSAATLLATHGRVPLLRVLDIAIQMAQALTAAEEHNILHRDIKPANILFTEKGEAKLADLGLAKSFQDAADDGLTQTGIACGTPLYFSPEQAKGSRKLDIRSDIYSLGITLYHLIEGSPPFTAESAYVIFQKHVHEELPPFKKVNPPVPEAVFKVIQKMTAKKPEDRYSSAQELLDALTLLKESLEEGGRQSQKKGLLERLGITKAS